jgi:hypothetical protein
MQSGAMAAEANEDSATTTPDQHESCENCLLTIDSLFLRIVVMTSDNTMISPMEHA